MSVALSGLGSSIGVADWRDRWRDRRAAIKSIVETVLERGESQLEPTLEEVKRALAYYALDDRDRAIVRTTFKDIRTIVRGFSTLDAQEQADFRTGKMAPSTAAAKLRSRQRGDDT